MTEEPEKPATPPAESPPAPASAEARVPAAGKPAPPGGEPPAADAAPKPPPKPAAPAKPAAPPLELSAGGQALAAAIAELALPVGEPKPDSLGNPMFEAAPADLVAICTALRDRLGMVYLSCLAPLDWPDRWEVAYHLYDFPRRTFLALKTRIPKEELKIPSVTPLWPAADWYEREGYDMYGVEFEGHPHLCRILMSDDWETFPLRKDHPMDVEGGY